MQHKNHELSWYYDSYSLIYLFIIIGEKSGIFHHKACVARMRLPKKLISVIKSNLTYMGPKRYLKTLYIQNSLTLFYRNLKNPLWAALGDRNWEKLPLLVRNLGQIP